MKRTREWEEDGGEAWHGRLCKLDCLISGGQCGADLAALEVAEAVALKTGGWMPNGFQTSEGKRPDYAMRFGLQEVPHANKQGYIERSKRNVDMGDATLAFRWSASPGTDATIGYCRTGKWGKAIGRYTTAPHRPCLVISELDHDHFANNLSLIYLFIKDHNVKTLNVCGHRKAPEGCKDYVAQIKRLLHYLLNADRSTFPVLPDVPLADQYDWAKNKEFFLLDPGHVYVWTGDTSLYLMPASSFQKFFFEEFQELTTANRCAGSPRASGGKYRFCTLEDVLKLWKDNRDLASALGTAMHNNFEDYANGKPHSTEGPEFQYFADFMADHPYLVPIAAERVFGNAFLQLGGTADIILRDIRDPDPASIAIGDYKRSRELRTTGYHDEYGSHQATACRADCNYQHFCFNMTTYKFHAEREGMKVTYMFLLGCHPDHGRYEYKLVEWDRDYANEVIAERMRHKFIKQDMGKREEDVVIRLDENGEPYIVAEGRIAD